MCEQESRQCNHSAQAAIDVGVTRRLDAMCASYTASALVFEENRYDDSH
jgi:hypothetical protein